jgi:uncharacterized protein YndB with AHSA1/START domain/uncharacterized glyoxalase superfamily protein PhnB
MKTDIEVTRVYPHPIDRVWAALISAEGLSTWLMPSDFVSEVGHEFTFQTAPRPNFDGIVRCRVIEIDPPHRMVWSWAGGGLDTTVDFTLTVLDAGSTRFRMRHQGFVGLGAEFARSVMDEGWQRICGVRLARYLDKLAGREVPAGATDCYDTAVPETTDPDKENAMPILESIGLISVPVSDQQVAKAFYLDQLGFTLVTEMPMGDNPNGQWIQLAPPGGGATITLVTWFDDLPPGACKLSIDSSDVDRAYTELLGRGVKIENEPKDEFWGRYFSFDDPDGNNWLVVQRAAG